MYPCYMFCFFLSLRTTRMKYSTREQHRLQNDESRTVVRTQSLFAREISFGFRIAIRWQRGKSKGFSNLAKRIRLSLKLGHPSIFQYPDLWIPQQQRITIATDVLSIGYQDSELTRDADCSRRTQGHIDHQTCPENWRNQKAVPSPRVFMLDSDSPQSRTSLHRRYLPLNNPQEEY